MRQELCVMSDQKSPSGGSTEPLITTYLHYKGRQSGTPVSGTFELTGSCNFRCRMCYINSGENTQVAPSGLTTDEWLSIAHGAKAAGTLFLLLTGGEPMIREDFATLYEQLIKMGFIIQINTNASLITPEIEAVLTKYPPSRINVSLYGGNAQTYERLCGLPVFDIVCDNIRRLKEAGIQVFINNVLTPYNADDMKAIQETADALGCHLKTATYIYPPVRRASADNCDSCFRFSPEDAAAKKLGYEKIHFSDEQYKTRLKAFSDCTQSDETECPSPEDKNNGVRCRAGSSAFWINSRGEMSMCGLVPDSRFNVTEMGFDSAWKAVREDAALIRMPVECLTCRYRSICNVCAAVCKAETGAFNKKPEYSCRLSAEINRLATKTLEEEYNDNR